MPSKDDIRHLAGLKQQIWQKMILLVQHIALMLGHLIEKFSLID